MATSFTLGISSADAITIYEEKDISIGEEMGRVTTRTAEGHLHDLINGLYKQHTLSVEFFPASWTAIVNSWWGTQAPLLFFVTSGSGGATDVHSVMIMGNNAPLNQMMSPNEDFFKGKITLEGY